MRDKIEELLRLIQVIDQTEDVRLLPQEVFRQLDGIQKVANFDYTGQLDNTLAWIKEGFDLARKQEEERIQEYWRSREQV